jgi:hypothetical protein
MRKGEREYLHGEELNNKMMVLSTEEIVQKQTEGSHKFQIPLTQPVRFNPRGKTELDPYLLGLLLGDGCLTRELSVTSIDNEILDYLFDLGFNPTGKNFTSALSMRPVGDTKIRLKRDLERLQLIGTYSHNKFIPKEYLFRSVEDRIALLQGLLDTDGHACKKGTISFCTVSPQLAEDVQFLVQSLGGWASITTKRTSYTYEGVKKEGQTAYNLYIQLPDKSIAFRLSRKRARMEGANFTKGREHSQLFRKMISIEEDGYEETVCIRVDHPNRLFLVDGFVVTHNSTLCLAGIAYDLCRLLCLKDPHDTFQLISSTQIVIAFMNTTLKLADSVLFNQFKDWINESPFFLEMRARCANPKKEFLPHKINLLSGSRGSHALGRAVVSGILSELNFQGEYQKEQAYQNYVQVRRRMESRFMRGEGFILPGRLWLDSSKNDETGFLEQHLKNLHHDPNALVVCKAVWEVLGPAGKVQYSGKKFPVFIGDQNRDPMILSGPGSSLGIPESLTIQVPIEYLKSFEQDIYGALRDIAGISTWSAHKFFPQSSILRRQMIRSNASDKEVIELDFDDPLDKLINYIDLGKLDKSASYFIHFDLGLKNDRTGISMTKNLGEVVIDRLSTSLESRVTRDCVFQTDLSVGIIPRPGKEVPIYKLKNFVIELMYQGFHIAGVSADGYQSANLLQDLKLLGLVTALVSVDRDRSGYDLWKNACLEGRWIGPIHALLESEFLNLLDLGKKINHPDPQATGTGQGGKPSKDIADSVAGSIMHCSMLSGRTKTLTALDGYLEMMDQARKEADVTEHLMQIQAQQKKRFRL